MRITLPTALKVRLEAELQRAGRHEIGGVLMGRDMGGGNFRIEDLHVQRSGGSFAFFLRQVQSFLVPLERFFDQTGHRYTEYNYLGEWHSHPSFSLRPSGTDTASMQEIVDDPEVGATFAVLLITKLCDSRQLAGRVYVFMPDRPYFEAIFELEDDETIHTHG